MVTLLLQGCGNEIEIQKTKVLWEYRLASEVELGMSVEEIVKWGDKYELNINAEPYSNRIFVRLKTFEKSGFPCKDWFLILEIQLDQNDRVSEKRLIETGTCL